MTPLALGLAMFCLNTPGADSPGAGELPARTVKPTPENQYCIYHAERNPSGGWRWNDMPHCVNTLFEVCQYVCDHPNTLRVRRHCGEMPGGEYDYAICAPGCDVGQLCSKQVYCGCSGGTVGFGVIAERATACVCRPLPCKRPRLFARLRCR